MRIRLLITSFAVLNAVLYSALLPLWEGFDEPFHFGYVQYLANGWGLPDARNTHLSAEVATSLLLAPASPAVQHNLPAVRTFSEYFSSPREQRLLAREQLYHIRPAAGWTNSDYLNYEAHHAPLAYALLAVPERALSSVPLPWRVLMLRIFAALSGILLLYTGMLRLCNDLRLSDTYSNAAIFCVLSCQMTWATIAHVANDWLAVPLTVWSLSMLIRYWGAPTLGTAARLGATLVAGLLTKAYFLAVLPLVLVACFWARKCKAASLVMGFVLLLAAPWYGRNLARYGVITGMQEARSGIGVTDILKAAPQLDWPALAIRNARWALWTGNNTFLTFSTWTLNSVLILLLFAMMLWAVRGEHKSAEWLTAAHCVLFSAALWYSTVLSFLYTRGAATGPSPWYSQVLLAPVFGLALLGCSRAGVVGRALASALVIMFGYILVASYFAKLIPLYAGFTGRTSFTRLMAWYTTDFKALLGNLGEVSLAPAQLVVGLALAVTALTVTLAIVSVRSFIWELVVVSNCSKEVKEPRDNLVYPAAD
ncbi:MAG TPA: hypothetical protein VKX49_32680 [Bryobacteraceae bacterium]|nr:hypothetical protein [Bryobacteraceae bacterium]